MTPIWGGSTPPHRRVVRSVVPAAQGKPMKERPILFSSEMARAILEDRKTQTRRIVRELPGNRGGPVGDHVKWFEPGREDATRWCGHDGLGSLGWVRCPYGVVGDRLWVRETWQAVHFSIDPETGYSDDVESAREIPKGADQWWSVVYAESTGWDGAREDRGFPWRPGIFMPRWASRITLEVTDVRVQRLQEISEDDARAEGVTPGTFGGCRAAFVYLWESINGKRASWSSNPWVWAISFRRLP